MKNKKSRKILFYATILLLLAVNLFPFLIMLMTSFKDSQEAIATTQTIFPKEWTFEHYQDIFNAEIFPFIMYFKNSLVISLIASVTAVVIGISGAYALSKLRFKARSKINASFYTVYMFSGILIVVPLFKIISGLGLYDTNTAMIDGLSRIQIIIRIIIPLAISGIISVFVYCFMVSWNDYLFASIFLSTSEKFTLPIGLNTLFSTPDYIWGRMMAASLVTALPVIIMYALSERFIKGDLVEGGVKG